MVFLRKQLVFCALQIFKKTLLSFVTVIVNKYCCTFSGFS